MSSPFYPPSRLVASPLASRGAWRGFASRRLLPHARRDRVRAQPAVQAPSAPATPGGLRVLQPNGCRWVHF
jgi:hypothetical protein